LIYDHTAGATKLQSGAPSRGYYQRREAGRPAGRATSRVRSGHQPQDRYGLTVPQSLLVAANKVIE
jgi:hypothetical protein